jgi:hypothetical protein
MTKAMPILLGAIALAASLTAETVTQSADFAKSDVYTGSGSKELVSSVFFSADLQPFDASLGTLQSFTVKWEASGLLTGTVGPDSSGSASSSFGGSFYLAGSGYGGAGGGNGGGAGPGQSLEVIFPPTPIVSEKTFTVAEAGVTYDPAILAAITGTSPFAAAFDSAVTVNYTNVVDLAASVTGTVTLTYTYEPPLRVTRIVRDVAQESVTIEWTSTAGKTYGVDASNDLIGWDPIAPAVSGGTFTETSVPSTVTRRFYRVHRNNSLQ